MYRLPYSPFVFSLLASTILSGRSLAIEPSGSVVKVDPAVNASGAAGARLLEVEGAVFMGDEIVASPQGLAQIRFIDDTKIVIGPNSRLVIDEFIYNPANNTVDRLAVNAVKGVFRFISGNSPHSAYSLRTPTMTIGFRGSIVDVAVRALDSTAAFTLGAGTICASGSCIDVIDDCTLHVATAQGEIYEPGSLEEQQRVAVYMPFLGGANASLDPEFQTIPAGCAIPDSRIFGTIEEGEDSNRGPVTGQSPPPPGPPGPAPSPPAPSPPAPSPPAPSPPAPSPPAPGSFFLLPPITFGEEEPALPPEDFSEPPPNPDSSDSPRETGNATDTTSSDEP